MSPLPWDKRDKREAVKRLNNRIAEFPEVQKQIEIGKEKSSIDIELLLDYWLKARDIFAPQKSTPSWMHFVFIPIILVGIVGAGSVLREATTKDNQPLKQQALTVLGAALTGAVGFYVGKK